MKSRPDVAWVSQTASISALKHRPSLVLQRLALGPIMLDSHGRPAAVLLCPGHWNAIVEYIDDLECGIEALQTELVIAKGEDEFDRLTPAEIEDWLGVNEVPQPPTPIFDTHRLLRDNTPRPALTHEIRG